MEWPSGALSSFRHACLGSVGYWFGDHQFGILRGALCARREVNKGSLIFQLHLFLPRLLLNHLRVMLFILCCCDLGSFQSLWFYVWWFVTAGAKPLYWSGLFLSSTILHNPTLTRAYLFLLSFCLPGLSFKPSFFMSWDCQNNLLFFWKPHHVRVTPYSCFPPLPWDLHALVQKQPSGKGEGTVWVPPYSRASWGANAVANQAVTGVWSGKMIGFGATSLALLFAVMKSRSQLFEAWDSSA